MECGCFFNVVKWKQGPMETKILTYANMNLDDPEERAQYYGHQLLTSG